MHTETKNGYTLKIETDSDPCNPRKEYDHLGTMACFHRRYDLGDDHDLTVGRAQEIATSPDYIALPLYLYDHGGITMSCAAFSCPFDSGQVGIIFVSRAAVRAEWKVKRISPKLEKQIRESLRAEVKEYDSYLTGDVYHYTIEDSDGDHVDSCGGFFGYDYALQEARAQLEHYAGKQLTLFDSASA